MKDLREAVAKAVETYNRYRSPEAKAKLIKFKEDRLVLEFEGPFCLTCGVYDYFEDFIYELKDLVDVQIKIESVERRGSESFLVEYVLKQIKTA